MTFPFRSLLAVGLALAVGVSVSAQEKKAATVNGEPILEKAVQRSLKDVPKEHQEKARQEILDFLIDNTLIDQYLRVTVKKAEPSIEPTKDEVNERLAKVKQEAAAGGMKDFAEILKRLELTEEELKLEIAAGLRWDKFLDKYAPEAVLEKFFNAHKDHFDGSMVRARHILIATKPEDDAKTKAAARDKLAGIKKEIEQGITKELAKVDAKSGALALAEARLKAANEIFSEAAKQSDCPSKKFGGDLDWFPRIGVMVEPFAEAAFKLQPGEISEVVETPFGYHVVLVVDRRPALNIKFKDAKEEVREVYGDRMRTDLVGKMRKTAKIEIEK